MASIKTVQLIEATRRLFIYNITRIEKWSVVFLKTSFNDIELKQYFKSEGYTLEGIISDIKEDRRKNRVHWRKNISEKIMRTFTVRHNHDEIQNTN